MEDEELQLQWAAIERLPTYKRLRTSLFDTDIQTEGKSQAKNKKPTDITKLKALDRHLFIENLINHIENDNLRLLKTLRDRIDRVDVKLPTIEVRYKNLSVDASFKVVEGKPLPTLWNSFTGYFSYPAKVATCSSQETKISILKDVSGVIKPSRLTLLLGPPGCGKSTLLKALAGKLDKSLKVTGEISYNGYKLDEFVPQKTSAYVSQYDLHIPEMTVRETIDFSARCQGVGTKADIMMEVLEREKEAGIVPDPDIDTYMKATSIKGQRKNLQTDYVQKILGLDICADVIVGDALTRGISGGQKKRLTTGEIIVGPTKALFMDDISTGLDTSTTFQIVSYLQQLVHITDATVLASLLQPAPEVFDLFDDVMLMGEGKIVYHGPRDRALQFFQECGFKCPQRKGAADFLQEVISRKDQAQYWYRTDIPYAYVSVNQFSDMFTVSFLGEKLEEELSRPYDKANSLKSALSFSRYSLSKRELLKACMAREWLLVKRNSFVYVFKTVQIIIVAIITMTVFIRTRMAVDLMHGNFFLGSLFYTIIRLMTNGVAELSLTVTRLPILFKHKEMYLYPAWAYCIPASMLKVPFSLIDSLLWTSITYYVIGYSPEVQRLFCQFLVLFALHLASTSMCRFIASIFRTMEAATTAGTVVMILMFLFGGFLIPRYSLPAWLRWGFWLSPMSHAEIGVSLNEFLAPRWQKVLESNKTIGEVILSTHGLNFKSYFYWISVGALLGFAIFFDIGFVLALSCFKSLGKSRNLISKKALSKLQGSEDCKNGTELDTTSNPDDLSEHTSNLRIKERTVLNFKPLTMAFQDVQYFVDVPQGMKERGFSQKKLQLLHDITGAFRPGTLTALMGVSGAGKTTLMDVLSGRKTGGTIIGDIRIGGYPKVQKTFARVSGYCEQYDIHSPQITVEESVLFSSWLRLQPDIDPETRVRFVEEVIETIELDDIRDSLVGIPGRTGLSTEQRKRLTIAVELVSNPSIIFMDEPTSGLDARAAAIVMRAVKNVVATGRTTVCTIHQPSIDIFETFDELILMKRGGQIIYTGKLGHNSSELIRYFESIPGVPKIKDNYNPATWMLEVTSSSAEGELSVDFASIYRESPLYRDTIELVRQLSEPQEGTEPLHFSSHYPQNSWVQFTACLWKQRLSYWRTPDYNLVRLIVMVISAVCFGAVFWQKGKQINNEQDLINIFGSMYIAVILLGVNNCNNIQPYVATERAVLYREKFAGMYSSWAYSFAQVFVEIPYVALQAMVYVAIIYPSIGYYWSAYKVFWYFYTTFCTFLYFVYLGMLITALSSNIEVASILAVAAYTILNLFSGFLIPGPKMPKWWIWCYWICPTAWSLNGLLTSQYGDIKDEILIFGEPQTVGTFLQDYYGFRHDQLVLVAVILIAIPAAFAVLFAICIKKLNFQKR